MLINKAQKFNRKTFKAKTIIFLVALLLILPNFTYSATLDHQFPKLANYYLKWGIDEKEAEALADWDILIIDMEAQIYSPQYLKRIREINPDVKILAYITSQEVRRDISSLDSKTLRRQLMSGFNDSWYLKDKNNQRVNWWPETWLINVNSGWNEYLPNFVANKIMSSGLWDGVFYDNTWSNVSWVNGNIDIDKDGQADSAGEIDTIWQDNMKKILSKTRQLIGNDKLIVGNNGSGYFNYLNGSMVENFPKDGWMKMVKDYNYINNNGVSPSFGILNTNTDNSGNKEDYQKMRFGLTSALVDNGYYSFDYGDKDHSQIWWYDEYSAFLGQPKGDAVNTLENNSTFIKEGFWKREFSNGLVLVNSTYSAQTIYLDGEFEKLHGKQDPKHNDGSITEKIVLGPRDGIILLRPLEKLVGSTFINGSFARVFDRFGKTSRTGFFAYDSRFKGGTKVMIKDIDNNGDLESIVVYDSKVEIYDSSSNKISTFYPYTKNYNQGINLTVGDLNGDGTQEIVTGTERGGGPQIRIFNHMGKLINPGFFAYATNFRGGVNVAIGDLNGDGTKEIIAGAGYGGGPHVRVFNANGKLINPGFFAYDPGFRGGVNVDVGDVDGDNIFEIITGPGFGGGPQVRVFNKDGQLLSAGFFAFDQNKRSGVEVIASDLDGNGKAEIIATTSDVFTLSGLLK